MSGPGPTWTEVEALALLSLLDRGVVRAGERARRSLEHAVAAGWASLGTRAGEIQVTERGRADLPAFLDRVLPDWRLLQGALAGGPISPTSARRARRRGRHPATGLLNLHTYAAHVARDAKAVPDREAAAAHGIRLTVDHVVRMRVHGSWKVRLAGQEVDLGAVSTVLGEVAVPERAVRRGMQPRGGTVRTFVTVENLGAFADLPAADGVAYVYVPGWDLQTAAVLLGAVAGSPIVHFGDVDPSGLEIPGVLAAAAGRQVGLYLPEWWSERVEGWSLPTASSWAPPPWAPVWVAALGRAARRLEQEAIVTDVRVREAMQRLGRGDLLIPGHVHWPS